MDQAWTRRGSFLHRHEDARTLLISLRRMLPYLSHANLYEFEDVAATLDDVDVFVPEPPGGEDREPGVAAKLRRRLEEATSRAPTSSEGAPYDDVIVMFQSLPDLERLRPLQRWAALGRRCSIVFQECWATSIVPGRSDFERLNQFDRVFLAAGGSVEKLGACIRTPVVHLPFGIDAHVFSPRDPGRPRTIDFYALGRRHPKVHEDLVALARRQDFFYAYDSIWLRGRGRFQDEREHRLLTSRMIQNTRFFAVNRGRFDAPDVIADQDEVNPRYYEGACAGATLVGAIPQTDRFADLMGWTDAVIPFDPETQEIVPLLEELGTQTERLETARRTGIRECLGRHDWLYRWRVLLAELGLDERPAMARREELLKKRAAVWSDPA